jgi:hypothetical protein
VDILTRPLTLARAGVNLLVVLLLGLAADAATASALEMSVKAAYLGKFGLFITWPAGAFTSADSSLQLCLLGDDPFGSQLDRNLTGRRLQGRSLQIRRLDDVNQHPGCHIIFISEADLQRRGQLLDSLRGSAALTVTDTDQAVAVGIINFVIHDNRVRFEIDEAAAAQAGLTIRARLLRLALTVKPRLQAPFQK